MLWPLFKDTYNFESMKDLVFSLVNCHCIMVNVSYKCNTCSVIFCLLLYIRAPMWFLTAKDEPY